MLEQRQKDLIDWIGLQLNQQSPQLVIISGDASFRRYFRFKHLNKKFIAVDAPPQHENNHAFQLVAKILDNIDLVVPNIIKVDFELGFIILDDLGDELYLTNLNQDNVDHLYQMAIDALLKMLTVPQRDLSKLPLYSSELLNQEMSLFNDWFIKQHLKIELTDTEKNIINKTFSALTHNALNQPQKFVHRDFHSRNLMLKDQQVAIIDFQDAVVGPISYDLVSLLKDCYIQWPEDKIKRWCFYYYQQLLFLNLFKASFEDFYQQFELMGMQRHIKVLGIFCRLYYRDNKINYLKDLQLTFDYLIQAVAKYPEFSEFYHFLQNRIQPLLEN